MATKGQIQVEYLGENVRDTYDVTNLDEVEESLRCNEPCVPLKGDGLSGMTFLNAPAAKLIVLIPDADGWDEFDDPDFQAVEYEDEDDDEDEAPF